MKSLIFIKNIIFNKQLKPEITWRILITLQVLLSISCNEKKSNETTLIDNTNKVNDEIISVEDFESDYPYPNNIEGYEKAGMELKNPIIKSRENYLKGEKLYLGFCKQCHGVNGDSDAPMIEKEKYPPPPVFKERLKKISEGNMFHSITYGKNLMPGNNNDLTTKQKWLLVNYIQHFAEDKK